MAISPPAMGLQETFGIAREVTYGSAVAPTIWFKASPSNWENIDDVLEMSGPSGGMVPFRYDATRPRAYKGTPQIGCTGQIIEAEFDDIGHLLSNAFGVPTFNTNTPVAGAHTHVWTMPFARPATTPTSVSAGQLKGLEDLRFAGAMIDTLALRAQPGAILQLVLDWIAQSGGAAEVDDADTEGYSTAPWMEFHHVNVRWHATPGTATGSLATLNAGSEQSTIEFMMRNGYRREQAAGNGVRGIREPTWAGYRTAQMTFSRDLFNDTFFNEYHGSTSPTWFSAIELRVQTTEFITGSTPYELRIYMPYAVIQRRSAYDGGPGIIPENLTFFAGSDGSVAPVTVTLINGTGSTPYGS